MNNRLASAIPVLIAGMLILQVTAAAQNAHSVTSAHFVIYYARSGADAVDVGYVSLVRDALEEAYDSLVEVYGFSIPFNRIEVDIASGDSGELGTEYFVDTGADGLVPVITIAPENQIRDYLSVMLLPCTLAGLVRSTAAHELFHVIQDSLALGGGADMSDLAFVEPLAVWAQEAVFPDVNDYLEDALDFLYAPDSIDFFYRTYDAGIFWVFVADRHGGAEAIARVLHASAAYEGRHAIDHAFGDQGMTFDDLWEEFAIAAAAGVLPDEDALRPLLASFGGKRKSGGDAVSADKRLPVSTYEGEWMGNEQTIDRSNANSSAPYDLWYADDAAGTPLRVAHAYGIDYLRIVARAPNGMVISFDGDDETVFRAAVVTITATGYTSYPLAEGDPLMLDAPDRYDEICIVVTRGESGTGKYFLTIEAGTGESSESQ